jgi:hypothetical protein
LILLTRKRTLLSLRDPGSRVAWATRGWMLNANFWRGKFVSPPAG